MFRRLRTRSKEPRIRDDRNRVGRRGEEIAARHLVRNGYRILERRFRTRFGEIDLVAEEGGDLVIVEVKTRRGTASGLPEEAVDARKRRRLARLAQAYMQRRGFGERNFRFDVVSVRLDHPHHEQVRLLRSAFSFDDPA
jgi:putative endonuclease